MDLSREHALSTLKAYTKSEALLKHAYAVEGVMRYFAREAGEDENYWGLIGLMHDIDWEEFPSTETHPMKGGEMLREKGYPDDFVHAVLAHGWEYSGIKPETLCEKYLYTIDELTGFITAVALVRPSKSLQDLELKSVKKKWKDKAFARGVNREVIEKGSELLNIPLETLIEQTITALRPVEKEIGLGS